MAGQMLKAVFDPVASGTADHTLLMVKAPANIPLKVHEWEISFQGQDNVAAPIRVQVLRVTTDGTGSAVTLKKLDPGRDETIQSTATQGYGGTNEPTAGEILHERYVHPQTGWHHVVPNPDDVVVPGGGRIAIKLQDPGVSVNVTGSLTFEE